MTALIEEVLAAWREGDRLLERLPPLAPDRETVALSIAALRELYQDLTSSADRSRAKIEHVESVLRRNQALIAEARSRLSE